MQNESNPEIRKTCLKELSELKAKRNITMIKSKISISRKALRAASRAGLREVSPRRSIVNIVQDDVNVAGEDDVQDDNIQRSEGEVRPFVQQAGMMVEAKEQGRLPPRARRMRESMRSQHRRADPQHSARRGWNLRSSMET